MIHINPQLLILRRIDLEHFESGNRIYFVVVNLDKAKDYPANFVCVLPTQRNSIVKPSTEFSRVFGSDSLPLAKRLLRAAWEDEDDTEIRAEIWRRLKLLDTGLNSRRRMPQQEKSLFVRTFEKPCQETR